MPPPLQRNNPNPQQRSRTLNNEAELPTKENEHFAGKSSQDLYSELRKYFKESRILNQEIGEMTTELKKLQDELEQTKTDLAKALTLIEEGKKDKSQKELRINPPSSFSGKRSEFPGFVDDFKLYLKVKRPSYDNDDKKISFVLSFFDKGEAAQWKTSFIRDKTTQDGEIELGSWDAFLTRLEEDF